MDEATLNAKFEALETRLSQLDARVAALEDAAGHADTAAADDLEGRVKALESHNGWTRE